MSNTSNTVRRVLLRLEGDLEQKGFQVRLEIGMVQQSPRSPDSEDAYTPQVEATGQLPPMPTLQKHLQDWQQLYQRLMMPKRMIKPRNITYDGSIDLKDNCQRLAQTVVASFQQWLQAESFQRVNLRLREELSRKEPIQLLIRSSNPVLAQLPWHHWDFVERYSNVEVAFSPPKVEPVVKHQSHSKSSKVRILAILGNSENINIDIDRRLLEQLPNAEVLFLVEPERRQLTDQLWDQPWDLLFFAGHSSTEANVGRLQINPTDSITIEDLRYGLRHAIAQGLQLAIFNSCEGSGLAHALADLQLPQLVVMQEPVPDEVAQQFLMFFLESFAADQSFYQAVRVARERLQGLEDEFPCASWLPVIYQTSAALPPTWSHLSQGNVPLTQLRSQTWAVTGGAVAAGLVVLLRLMGLLQGLELAAFDHLMRRQPPQALDDRILLVEVTENDIANQPPDARRNTSISDATLAQLLSRLNEHQPRLIAMDIYRDFPVESGHEALVSKLKKQSNLIVPCRLSTAQGTGTAPPPETVAVETQKSRIGYTNVPLDPDDLVRRQVLMQNPPDGSLCQAQLSLAMVSAMRYLAEEGIDLGWTDEEAPVMRFQDTVLTPLNQTFGGYQNRDERGHQIMLRYRASANGAARSVTLQEVLNGEVDPSWIQDRIVVIGNTDPSFKDRLQTPVRTADGRSMYGVHLHAHAISQLLSAVLDGQPLIWVWSQGGEMVWILAWGLVGGGLAWRLTRLWQLSVAGGVSVILLYGGSYGFFLVGGWIPLVPAVLALGGGMVGGTAALSLKRWIQTHQQSVVVQ